MIYDEEEHCGHMVRICRAETPTRPSRWRDALGTVGACLVVLLLIAAAFLGG